MGQFAAEGLLRGDIFEDWGFGDCGQLLFLQFDQLKSCESYKSLVADAGKRRFSEHPVAIVRSSARRCGEAGISANHNTHFSLRDGHPNHVKGVWLLRSREDPVQLSDVGREATASKRFAFSKNRRMQWKFSIPHICL